MLCVCACSHTFDLLCLSFLSQLNPFYGRILPRVSAGVNLSLRGFLLRQRTIEQRNTSHSPSSLQLANHKSGDDGQAKEPHSFPVKLLSLKQHYLFH